ncbi:Phosphotransferase enzyme family protein [Marinomonas gallaica]|uniref:Phosphotransferase enzyme family protein n=1 Tax=Marinomonas gallaica TaxID=1806667 RepID=A0A1C3JTY0_9GAMM|nr:aminoglycoside phosphotransferase family protein [Marinomonas gallaica]SBT18555.1 Phosphotransferase enzyme family protein [Marinomonas gallaica]SBT21510.1 Phosphotransferase enzyme family protein [Marinomonas gallaica]
MSAPAPLSIIKDDLTFLLSEIEKHGVYTELLFKTGSPDILKSIRARRGYVQTLREKIELACARLLERRKLGTSYYNQVVAVRGLANALAAIARGLLDTVEAGSLDEQFEHPDSDNCLKFIKRVNRTIALIKVGFSEDIRRTGIKVARRSEKLKTLYDDIQMETLSQKGRLLDVELKASILCNGCLRRLVDQLSDIAETLIKVDLGHVATLKNYKHLKHVTSELNYDLNDVKVRRLALTRSGSAIASVSHQNAAGQHVLAVYKEGDRTKIDEEVQGVQNWRNVNPKLAPDVLVKTQSDGETSALLIEHIPGKTLESLLREGKEKALEKALKTLFKTLNDTWQATLTSEHSRADFMQQLRKRIKDSVGVHPEYFTPEQRICGLVRPSFYDIVDRVEAKESRWPSPFSVLIHGDFNVDNLIYDDVEERIYFIDLHRSTYFDYVQDISVLMVSIYRLQILEKNQRKVMMDCAKDIYKFGQRFAKRHNDDSFDLRLAAGLARSFATSTRFVLDKKLSTRMYLRSRFILETLAALPIEKEAKFKLPLKELYSE